MPSANPAPAALPQLPPDFFDKQGRGGSGTAAAKAETLDTLPADFFEKPDKPAGSPRKGLTGRDPRDPRNPKSPFYKTTGEQAGGLALGTLDVAAPALALAGGAGAGRALASGGIKAVGPMAVKAARDLATAYIAGEGVSKGLKAIGVNGVLANVGGLLAGMGAAGTLEEILGRETLDKLAAKAYKERFGVPPKTAGDKLRARGLAQAEVAKAKAEGMPPKAPKPKPLSAKAQVEEAERQKAAKIAESAERIRAEQGPPKRFDASGVQPVDIPVLDAVPHTSPRRSPEVPFARTPVRELTPKERLAKRIPFYEREGAPKADIPEAETQPHATPAAKLNKLFKGADKRIPRPPLPGETPAHTTAPPPVPGALTGRTTGKEMPETAQGRYGAGFGIYEVPVEKVVGTEDISGNKIKMADAERYAKMTKAGSEAPPLWGHVDADGNVSIQGARRLAAAKANGQKTVRVAIGQDYQPPQKGAILRAVTGRPPTPPSGATTATDAEIVVQGRTQIAQRDQATERVGRKLLGRFTPDQVRRMSKVELEVAAGEKFREPSLDPVTRKAKGTHRPHELRRDQIAKWLELNGKPE